jgi:hypothetical protein
MAHDVFISHSSKDKQAADAICHALESSNIKCWIAPRDVNPGEEYAGELTSGIKNCKIFLLIFSKESNSSKPVSKEIETAFRYEKTVIPFRIEHVEMRESLEYYLSNLHWLDAYPDDREFKTLVKAVKNSLGITDSEQSEQQYTPPPQQYTLPAAKKSPVKAIAGAAIAVAVLAVAVLIAVLSDVIGNDGNGGGNRNESGTLPPTGAVLSDQRESSVIFQNESNDIIHEIYVSLSSNIDDWTDNLLGMRNVFPGGQEVINIPYNVGSSEMIFAVRTIDGDTVHSTWWTINIRNLTDIIIAPDDTGGGLSLTKSHTTPGLIGTWFLNDRHYYRFDSGGRGAMGNNLHIEMHWWLDTDARALFICQTPSACAWERCGAAERHSYEIIGYGDELRVNDVIYLRGE